MGKLFGTDGIRGVANTYPITAEMAVKVGKAVAHYFKNKGPSNTIVIGKDTRLSGDMLVSAIASGVCAMGVNAIILGTFPTPGVAFLTRKTGSAAGIMISASHNPYEDNGIKVFDQNGFKPSVVQEAELEALILEKDADTISAARDTGIIEPLDSASDAYMRFLMDALPNDFSLNKMKIIMDCANGATHHIAPKIFQHLGADVKCLFTDPDGKNINDQCGSQHPEKLSEMVIREKAAIGLAFDGDGDRLIAVDEKGTVLTGDQIMFVCANALKKQNALKNNMVISTVMSNIGFKQGLAQSGIQTTATNVGDRHVMEKMKAMNAVLGGEDSGHTIFLAHHTTGDGILTALKLIESVLYEQKPLSEMAARMTIFPQVLINVEVKSKPDLSTIPGIQNAISEVENKLGEGGRVLVRYSGTQSICRVMVEGPTEDETRMHAEFIAGEIKKALG